MININSSSPIDSQSPARIKEDFGDDLGTIKKGLSSPGKAHGIWK